MFDTQDSIEVRVRDRKGAGDGEDEEEEEELAGDEGGRVGWAPRRGSRRGMAAAALGGRGTSAEDEERAQRGGIELKEFVRHETEADRADGGGIGEDGTNERMVRTVVDDRHSDTFGTERYI